MRGADCSARFSSCRTGASGQYAVTVAGCMMGGAALATLSFWCAGCAGVALGGICIGGAVAVLSSQLDACGYQYVDCVS
jgi:hypothetical protein